MKRRKRRGGVYKDWRVFWCSYMVDGEQVKENTRCLTREEAIEFRATRLIARGQGTLVKGAKDVTVKDLRRLAEDRYLADGRRASGLRRLKLAWNALEVGLPSRALDVTSAAVSKYERERLGLGRARATVNFELACLRRAWRLATRGESPLLPPGRMPVIEIPDPQNARQVTITRKELTAILAKLPEWAAAVAEFLSLTGWRVSEALALKWANVDERAKIIRLEASETKGKQAKTFPFDVLPALAKLLTRQRRIAKLRARQQQTVIQSDFVFTKDGGPVSYKPYRVEWRRATCDAKCEGKWTHDLRRMAATALVEAGVDESSIMRLCGWRTPAMFRRYHVTNEDSKRAAVAKLAASMEPPKPSKFVAKPTIRRRTA